MDTKELIKLAIKEDLGGTDLTTDTLKLDETKREARIISKEEGIICGTEIAKEIFLEIDSSLKVKILINDGNKIKRKDIIMKISGNPSSILKGERVALNFLQRLSGIAKITNKYAKKLEFAKVYDTRKTTPLLRELEKYAVKTGGGENHRFGLFDEILIKENHIEAVGSIKEAILRVRKNCPNKKIEIEVKNYYEFLEALKEKADIILLDNMKPRQIRDCLKEIKDFKPEIEVSGGINLENINKYDLPQVDRISVGALTHSVKSLDLSLVF
jgi:nicotinate-nucleotide pyrophosphorylase (carboxylating)